MRDPQMKFIRREVNAIIEACAVAAEQGGAAAVRAMKVVETDQLPPGRGVVVSPEYAEQLAKQAREREAQT